MPINQEMSRQFRLYAELLLLHGEDERLADYLAGAAYRLPRLDEGLSSKALSTLFRPPIVALIREFETTGTIAALEELIQLTPAGLFDMMRIKGLGGKKLHTLWRVAKIDSVEKLLEAAQAGKLHNIPGFGVKTEQNIIAAIPAINDRTTRFHYADVADIADGLVEALRVLWKTNEVNLCGDIRRQSTTVERIDIVTSVLPRRLGSRGVKKWLNVASTAGGAGSRGRDAGSDPVTLAHTLDEIPVCIHHSAAFITDLFRLTGSDRHVAKVLQRIKRKKAWATETALYASAGLPFIPPELREDLAEWNYAGKPVPLVTTEDIRGVVHNHTTWSDGVDTLEDFVQACIRKGYEYAVISDHSQNAHYAGGLKPDKVRRQLEAIDKLNASVAPFRVFKSIECDILVSGDLDYDKALLKAFDLVIVSVHQQLKMTEAKATARLIKAIENPLTAILGHMTGRQLLVRPGYPVDFKKIIDACAANSAVIEVNANPYRLDMDWAHLPYALEKGVMISIDPDAHSIQEIDNIRWGVSAARKGGLTPEMTWNAQPVRWVEKWLARR